MVEDAHPVADPLDVGQHVGREDDRGGLAQLGDEREDVATTLRIERADRLVEDEEPRPIDECLGDPEPLAHPARIPADPPVRRIGQPDPLEHLGRALARVARGAAVQPRDHLDQLATAHPAVVARVLVEHADAEPPVRPGGIDPAVVDDDRAAGRPGESDEQPQRRGLAGPVRPEQTEHRSGRHVEVRARRARGRRSPRHSAS